MSKRTVVAKFKGIPASDGAGVKLTRMIGTPQLDMLDPFLMLDQFKSDNPDEYIAGFPDHPHRGFETVTYMLAGRMRHKDSAGNEGVIEKGGIQWMTAAKGIVHSEMPEQSEGLLSGFQLWVNLPASEKMNAPGYQEFVAENVPVDDLGDGSQIRVITGTTASGVKGPVSRPSTDPTYFDVDLVAGAEFTQNLPEDYTAFAVMIDGVVSFGDQQAGKDEIVVLGNGDEVTIKANDDGARFLFITGKPLREPVARGGPFVMNTRAEVLQAFDDFRSGRFVA